MTSEDGEKYLTKRGQEGMKTDDRCDITGLLAAHHFNHKIITLKPNEYFFATDFSHEAALNPNKKSPAHIYKYYGETGHSLNRVGPNGTFETVFLDINDASVKELIRYDIRINYGSWFLYNDKLYFASKKYNKILNVSMYYTDAGMKMLLDRRYLYIRLAKTCNSLREVQMKCKSLRLIPLYCINL